LKEGDDGDDGDQIADAVGEGGEQLQDEGLHLRFITRLQGLEGMPVEKDWG